VRVLFVSPVVPWPLDTGGRIRTAMLLRALQAHAQVHLWAVRQDWLAAGVPGELARDCAEVRVFERSPLPRALRPWRTLQERWFHSAELARALDAARLAREFDLVHVDEPSALRALPDPLGVPLVVHHHKLDTLLHARLGERFEAYRCARLEREAARRTRHHVLTSPDDARVLARRFPALELAVVPNGFDPAYFTPLDVPRERARLLFLGTLDYAPNLDGLDWFLAEIWPRLRARAPGLVLDVVGRDAPERLQRRVPEGVRVLGRLDDVRPALARATALVAALRVGGGTRLKVVDALAMRCPVVATRAAIEGLDLAHGREVLLADDTAGYAREVQRLLDAPELGARLAEAGRARVLELYPWAGLAAQVARAWRAAASCGDPVRTGGPAGPPAQAAPPPAAPVGASRPGSRAPEPAVGPSPRA
jgi:glycosyltransferase involved in cell wall biosynthesis